MILSKKERADNFELTFSAQRDVTCAHLQACPLMRRFKSYAGLSLTPTATRIRTEYESNGALVDLVAPQTTYRYDVWTGLSHTVVYNATQHLAISSAVEGRVAPATLFSGDQSGSYRPATRFGVRIGAAYRF